MTSRIIAVLAGLMFAQCALALDLGIQVGTRVSSAPAPEPYLVVPHVTLSASSGFIGKTGLAPEIGLRCLYDNSKRPRKDGYVFDEHPDYEGNDKIGLHGAIRLTYSGEQKARRIPLHMWAAAGVGVGYGSKMVGGDLIENTWTFLPSTIEYIRLHYSTSATQSLVAEFSVEQQYVGRYFDKLSGSHVLSLGFGYRFRIADFF